MFGWKRRYQELLISRQDTLDELAVQRGVLYLDLEVAKQTLRDVAESDPRHNSSFIRNLASDTLREIETEKLEAHAA